LDPGGQGKIILYGVILELFGRMRGDGLIRDSMEPVKKVLHA
jgi:hypothetical protein